MATKIRKVVFRVPYLVLMLLGAFNSSAQSAIQYLHDNSGKLIGVIDASGNAAAYKYDAVGNLLSISRYTASQVSVLSFSPQNGPAGTLLTISGTGYSATLGQNTVTVNGVSAAINSATTNQIVAVIPAAASTGPISVTTPAGTYTTLTNFTVTSGSGIPAITSFLPTVATAGTNVSVSGTNFDPNAANDRLRFNTTEQIVTTATTTTLSASVPVAATSGRLNLLTLTGSSLSSQDLFIPFGSHVASDVGFTGRTSLKGTQTITLSSKKKIV